jgi:hypothetical protein
MTFLSFSLAFDIPDLLHGVLDSNSNIVFFVVN